MMDTAYHPPTLKHTYASQDLMWMCEFRPLAIMHLGISFSVIQHRITLCMICGGEWVV